MAAAFQYADVAPELAGIEAALEILVWLGWLVILIYAEKIPRLVRWLDVNRPNPRRPPVLTSRRAVAMIRILAVGIVLGGILELAMRVLALG